MCRCEGGCNNARCSCFKNDRGCSESCRCVHCANPRGSKPIELPSSLGSLETEDIKRQLQSMERDLKQVVQVAKMVTSAAPSPNAFEQRQSIGNRGEYPTTIMTAVVADSPSPQQHQYQQQLVQPYGHQAQQSLAPMASMNQAAYPGTQGNESIGTYSLIKTGGVTAFFADLETQGLRFAEGDSNSRLYHYHYPGTPTVVLMVHVAGLPDGRVRIHVRSVNAEIFHDFTRNFLSKYE